ncbi:YidC/Oxa1 family membrane protein insertase [Ruminococcaceae bacterium KH2T8]|nr:YidC/Oxa1 family membrane protein insertase [Ruminococcaceae bacterium KH2T8]
MELLVLKFSLFEPIAQFFGWLTRIFFDFFGNYGVAIIVLTVVIRFALIPLNVRSQKSMLKMQALSGKTAELQRKYGDDKQRYQEEVMKMQKENGAMGFSGCLLPFIQMFLLIPMYRIVSGPLHYIAKVPKENINNMIELAKSEGLAEGKSLRALSEINHIGLIDLLNHNADFMHKCIDKGYIAMGQMIDLNFLGVDLTKVPSWKPLEIIREPSVYLPLLMFPLLVVVINLVQMKLMQFLKPGYKEQKEAKQREKNNPARAGQTPEDQAEATTKMMNWMMPVIMLITTFSLPAAMGLYWVIGGIMGIVTNLITYFMFTKPYELKKQELAEKKANAFKKKKADDSSEDQNKGKKKKKK